ncbi:hypothetical protein SAMD00019534_086840 [Acytostelium subglobosum LB1]|uniref:hypothetical protein n=1 Tax=Acytostelium subglobosum LB1 TaxID=1410327 RepID=UPI000644E1FD|nr:hypothetical protein SAMD00019534_086840 [Acytostelium subglobosum LB1]GAM25509.1 hypothetical protein SAMD00019534_086840 [Acytostelium subglobosum LB1]|eukprot:XP_012751495.1 hypothetical protein SAMD00019534_086840 [Acytostelium subglobosum LB1]
MEQPQVKDGATTTVDGRPKKAHKDGRPSTLRRTISTKIQSFATLRKQSSSSTSQSATNKAGPPPVEQQPVNSHSTLKRTYGRSNTLQTSMSSYDLFSDPSSPSTNNNNTLNRRSIRLTQQMRLEEVTKLYAPLSGSEYLSSSSTDEMMYMPPQSMKQMPSKMLLSSSHTMSSSYLVSSSVQCPSIFAAAMDKDKEKEKDSPISSPSSSPVLTPAKSVMASVPQLNRFSLSASPVQVRKSPPPMTMMVRDDSLASTPVSSSLTGGTHPDDLTFIKFGVINNCQFISNRMAEYLQIIKSLPDMFMLSHDILSTEYEYLIKDTRTIINILEPLMQRGHSGSFIGQHPAHGVVLTEAIVQSITSITQCIQRVDSELKRSNVSEKRVNLLTMFITAVKYYLESGEVLDVPKSIDLQLGNSTGELETISASKDYDNDYIYKSGYLVKKGTKGPLIVWKNQWFVLTVDRLSIYSNESKTKCKPKKEIMLSNIVSIEPTTKYDNKNCYILKLKSPKSKLVIKAKTEKEGAHWMLAIDGLPRKNFETNQSCINLYIKDTLLETISSNMSNNSVSNTDQPMSGGVIRCSKGEEWIYRGDGELYNSVDLDHGGAKAKQVRYKWNGQQFVPSKECMKSYGNGKWNGVRLGWYFNNTLTQKYLWRQESNEYINNQSDALSYMWTSPQALQCKRGGASQWYVEGNVPPTVVMFLQCLRQCRLSHLQ